MWLYDFLYSDESQADDHTDSDSVAQDKIEEALNKGASGSVRKTDGDLELVVPYCKTSKNRGGTG